MTTRDASLIVRAAGWTCALPLREVHETLRELASVPCAGAPSWVRGATVIRGTPVPVVDLAAFLGGESSRDAGRFVTVRSGAGEVALRVDSVLGVRVLGDELRAHATPLLDANGSHHAETLATLDGQLLAFLELTQLVPQELYQRLADGHAS